MTGRAVALAATLVGVAGVASPAGVAATGNDPSVTSTFEARPQAGGGAAVAGDEPLDADRCAEIALADNARLDAEEARVKRYEARLARVQAIHYPRIDALGWVAPMHTVRRHGEGPIDPSGDDVTRDHTRWGPYARLKAQLEWPVYGFGRIEAAEDAARARKEVQAARLRQAENAVAREARTLYYARLYGQSLLPSMENAAEILDEATDKAQELYDEASGEVTQADLQRLKWGRIRLEQKLREVRDGIELATSALKHVMGLPARRELSFADDRLPEVPEGGPPELASLLEEASRRRPEWAELRKGREAALSLAQAERLANAPVLAIGGRVDLRWAPTRDRVDHPFLSDAQNGTALGFALALKWDFHPWKADAKAEEARARAERAEAMKRFARTGIPLQVRRAHQEVVRARDQVERARDGVVATRKWMTFAKNSYDMGLGEVEEVLKGLRAHLQAKRSRYELLRDYWQARARVDFAVGRPSGRTTASADDGRARRP